MKDELYALLLKIPKGRVTTYKSLAQKLNTKAYRHIGTLLSQNKDLVRIPCHRVVRSDGCVGEYAGGASMKKKLLMQEGVSIENGKVAQRFFV